MVRGSDFLEKNHQICWFSGCDFHLPVKNSLAIYAFWKNSGDFSAAAAAAAAAAATSEEVWVVRSFTIRERISSAWRMSWSSAKAVCPRRRRRRRRRGRRRRRRRNDE